MYIPNLLHLHNSVEVKDAITDQQYQIILYGR